MGKKKRGATRPEEIGLPSPAEGGTEPAYVWLFLGIFLLVPVVPWPFVHSSNRLFATHQIFRPAEILVFWTLTLFSAIFCLRSVDRWFRHLRVQPVDVGVLALFLLAALSCFFSVNPAISSAALLGALVFLIFYMVAKYAVTEKGVLEQVVACLHLSIAVNNVYAIGQLLGIDLVSFGIGEQPIGLLGNRNDLAQLLGMTLPLGLFRGWTVEPLYQRLGRINFYVSFLILLATRCRAGIVAGLVTVLCYHLLKREQDAGVFRRQRKPFPRWLKRLIGVTLALTLLYLMLMGWVFAEKSRTFSSRLFMWSLVLQGVREAPLLGHGFGTFGDAFQRTVFTHFAGIADDQARLEAGTWRFARYFRHAHNEYLQVLFELGAVGLGLFLIVLYLVLREFHSSYLAHGNVERIRWYPLFGAVLVGGLIQALAGFPFQVYPTAVIFALALAVVSSFSLEERAGTSLDRIAAAEDEGAEQRALKMLPFVGLLGFLLWWGLQTWLAEVHLYEGMILRREGNLRLARDVLERSLDENPRDGRTWNQLGQTLFDSADLARAEKCFLKALTFHTDSAVLVNLGCVAAAKGNLAEALRFFKQALEMEPHSSENHYRIGNTFATLKDFRRAADALQRALTINVRDLRVGWALGKVLAEMGHVDEARVQFELNLVLIKTMTLEEDPTGRTIEVEKRRFLTQNFLSLAALFEKLGKHEEAADCYVELKRYNPQAVRPVAEPSARPQAGPDNGLDVPFRQP